MRTPSPGPAQIRSVQRARQAHCSPRCRPTDNRSALGDGRVSVYDGERGVAWRWPSPAGWAFRQVTNSSFATIWAAAGMSRAGRTRPRGRKYPRSIEEDTVNLRQIYEMCVSAGIEADCARPSGDRQRAQGCAQGVRQARASRQALLRQERLVNPYSDTACAPAIQTARSAACWSASTWRPPRCSSRTGCARRARRST